MAEGALHDAEQAMAPFTDRTLDVTVTQSAGDHTCSNPRAVLHLITDLGDNTDEALRDLQRAPAFDIGLSLSDNSPGDSKVARQSRALSLPAMTSTFFGIPQELTGRVKLPFPERAFAERAPPQPQPPTPRTALAICVCALNDAAAAHSVTDWFGIFLFSGDDEQLLLHIRGRYSMRL